MLMPPKCQTVFELHSDCFLGETFLSDLSRYKNERQMLCLDFKKIKTHGNVKMRDRLVEISTVVLYNCYINLVFFFSNDTNPDLFTESQLLPNSQHHDGHECNSNLPKKRGRPRKPLGMKSNNSHGSTSCSRNLGDHYFETDPGRISPQQIFNEEVVSSRESRKRKRETVETSRSILATTISTTSYSNPGIVNSKESNDTEVVEELNLVSFQPMLKKLPQEKKSRKRKPKKFISPFLATTISDTNTSVQEEQICQSTTGSNQIIAENELFIEEQHSMPAAEADKSQTTVHSPLLGGTNLTFNKPHDFASVGEQYCKSSLKVLGYEYVPSSNPNSPQIFPTEGKTYQKL